MTFDDGDKLLIKGGKIIEKEETKIYPLNTYVPNSGYTIIQAAELYRIGEKFEIHFLIENRDEMDKGKVWYLTIQGTDIREIVTTQNLMFREDLKKIQKKRNKNNGTVVCAYEYKAASPFFMRFLLIRAFPSCRFP